MSLGSYLKSVLRYLCRHPRADSAVEVWDRQRTWRRAKWLIGLLLLATLVLGWHPARRKLQDWYNHRHRTPLTWRCVQLLEAPAWMPLGFRARLAQLVADYVDPDPMSPQGLQQAVDALYASGWVDRVHFVRRTNSRILVKAEYRTPVAFVTVDPDQLYLVDRAARLLPGRYQPEHLQRLALPQILGTRTDPPQNPGQPWPDPAVRAGIQLLLFLSDQPFCSQISAVDVSQRDPRGRLHLCLITTHGGRVVWGLPPGEEGLLQPPAALRKSWLAEIYRQFGSIDMGGQLVEVFGPAPFVRPPEQTANRTSTPQPQTGT